MATTKVYNMQGQVIGEIELMDSVILAVWACKEHKPRRKQKVIC